MGLLSFKYITLITKYFLQNSDQDMELDRNNQREFKEQFKKHNSFQNNNNNYYYEEIVIRMKQIYLKQQNLTKT